MDPLAGVCGHPIGQSKSPRLFRHWFHVYGIEGSYYPHNTYLMWSSDQQAESMAASAATCTAATRIWRAIVGRRRGTEPGR